MSVGEEDAKRIEHELVVVAMSDEFARELAVADADLLGQCWALLIELSLLLAAPEKLLLPVRALLVSVGQVSELT